MMARKHEQLVNMDCIYLSYIGIYGYIEKYRFYIY